MKPINSPEDLLALPVPRWSDIEKFPPSGNEEAPAEISKWQDKQNRIAAYYRQDQIKREKGWIANPLQSSQLYEAACDELRKREQLLADWRKREEQRAEELQDAIIRKLQRDIDEYLAILQPVILADRVWLIAIRKSCMHIRTPVSLPQWLDQAWSAFSLELSEAHISDKPDALAPFIKQKKAAVLLARQLRTYFLHRLFVQAGKGRRARATDPSRAVSRSAFKTASQVHFTERTVKQHTGEIGKLLNSYPDVKAQVEKLDARGLDHLGFLVGFRSQE